MTILDTLKYETKKAHQEAEKILIFQLKSLKSPYEYAQLLEQLYIFYTPIETILLQKISSKLIPDISKRIHMPHILEDLKILEYKLLRNPEDPLIAVKTPSHALGILYVIEGSTMGGQIIAKMINENVYMNGLDATNYFSSYKEETHIMWNSFKQNISSIEKNINDQEMLKGAQETFEKLSAFLEATMKPLENTNVS